MRTPRPTAQTLESLAVTMVLLCGPLTIAEAIRVLMAKSRAPRSTCADALRLGVNHRSLRTRRTTGGEWTVGAR